VIEIEPLDDRVRTTTAFGAMIISWSYSARICRQSVSATDDRLAFRNELAGVGDNLAQNRSSIGSSRQVSWSKNSTSSGSFVQRAGISARAASVVTPRVTIKF